MLDEILFLFFISNSLIILFVITVIGLIIYVKPIITLDFLVNVWLEWVMTEVGSLILHIG